MNLDPFNIYTDDQIWKALELSHLKDFVLEKEKKLDFDCPQGGSNLRYVNFLAQTGYTWLKLLHFIRKKTALDNDS